MISRRFALVITLICISLLPLEGICQITTYEHDQGSLGDVIGQIFESENVEVSNIQFTGSTSQQGFVQDIGTFDAPVELLGIESGLILTGGMLDAPEGLAQPASENAQYWKWTPGDSILDLLVTSSNTRSAAVVEFDFVPNGDSISFTYVFVSDEYPNQVCHRDNDIFAFHISGPGIDGLQNMALVPGTNLPVGNSTINDTSKIEYWTLFDESLCGSVDYPELYVDHSEDTAFIFNGGTVPLVAGARTIPCETYHLRIAIAEGGNSMGENSAVFIEANSFNSEPIKLEPSVSYSDGDTVLYEGCGEAIVTIRRTYNLDEEKIYDIEVSGTAESDIDYNGVPDAFVLESGQMFDTIVITPVGDGYGDPGETITLTVGDTLCNGRYYESEITLTLFEKEEFTTELTSSKDLTCDSAMLEVDATGALAPVHYSWSTGERDTFAVVYYDEGDYSGDQPFSVTVTDACGNQSIESTTIEFQAPPIAAYTYSPEELTWLDSKAVFTDISDGEVVSRQWAIDSDLESDNGAILEYNFVDTGQYVVSFVVTSEAGCKDSIIDTVQVLNVPSVFIPNAFTPDQDGLNDYLEIEASRVTRFDLVVIDRWGTEVWSTTDPEFKWGGEGVASGVYNYSVEVVYDNQQVDRFSGSLNIIR